MTMDDCDLFALLESALRTDACEGNEQADQKEGQSIS